MAFRLEVGLRGIGHAAVRHNQSPSRNARSWSSGRIGSSVLAGGDASEGLFLHLMSAWI